MNIHFKVSYEIRKEDKADIILSATSREEAIEQAKALGSREHLYAVYYPKIHWVNEAGMKLISNFIKENLKKGHLLYDDQECLNAWARIAENSIGECGTPQFEIDSIHSVSGRPENCYFDINEHFDYEISDLECDYEKI